MPSSLFARSRPSFCDWLKERSLNLPMSLTSATSLPEPPLELVVVVVPLLLLLLPPQPTTSRSAETPSNPQTTLIERSMPVARERKRADPKARPSSSSARGRLELGGNLELLLDDVRLVGVHQLDVRLRHGRVDLADAHAAVLQVEEQVAAGLEPAVLRLVDRLEDAVVDALDPGREHAARMLVLVLVDADAPDLRGRSGLQGAEATAAGDLEEHLGALRDHVLGDRLALVGRDEVLRVVDLDGRPGDGLLRTELVARDPDVHRRDLQAADGADVLLAHLLRHLRGEHADQAAGLVGRVRQAHHVLATAERRVLGRVVGDREVDLRVLLRDRVRRVGEQEAGRDDQVRVQPDSRSQVRDVVRGRVRLKRLDLDVQLLLSPDEPFLLRLVERAIVELADVADERGPV